MIYRLKSAWKALCGSPVLCGSGLIAVAVDDSGNLAAIYLAGLRHRDAALKLYEAADELVAIIQQEPCGTTRQAPRS